MYKRFEKEQALALRKSGFSYNEILEKVHVAKSTLSLWLREVGLSNAQQQRITEKRVNAQKKGAHARHAQRLQKEQTIIELAKKEAFSKMKDPLWLTGVMLYWAEGAKQKPWSPSTFVKFANNDARMHEIFLRWLRCYCNALPSNFVFELYVHDSANHREARKWWSKALGIELMKIRVYLKKHKTITVRKNITHGYYGMFRITLRKSVELNRRIEGWRQGVVECLLR